MQKILILVLMLTVINGLSQVMPMNALAANPDDQASVYPPLNPTKDGQPLLAAHYLDVGEDGEIRLALQVLAPGAYVESIRIDNVGGRASLWRSDGFSVESAPLTVISNGRTLADGSEKMSFGPLGEEEELLELTLLDNGAFNNRQTDFRITVFLSGGARVLCLLKPPMKFFKISSIRPPLDKDQYNAPGWLERISSLPKKLAPGDSPPQKEKDFYIPYDGWWEGCYVTDDSATAVKFLDGGVEGLCHKDAPKSNLALVSVRAYLNAEEAGKYTFSAISQASGQGWWGNLTGQAVPDDRLTPKAIYLEKTRISAGTETVVVGGGELNPGLYEINFLFLGDISSNPLENISLMIKRPSDIREIPISGILLGDVNRLEDKESFFSGVKGYVTDFIK